MLCKHFLKGSCRHKERCWFSHQVDKPESPQDAVKINESAQEEQDDAEIPVVEQPSSFCDKPAEPMVSLLSTLSINEDETSSVASLQMEDETTKCGICLESIAGNGNRFALLSNCYHPFCYLCAQSWHRNPSYRKSRKDKDTTDSNCLVKHSCPICRTDSEYMFPSKNYLIGAEKDAYIAQYKADRVNRKCKFFDGKVGSCPFGQECFYAHLDEDGKDLKPCDKMKGSKKSKVDSVDGIEYSDISDDEETEGAPFSWGIFGDTPPEHTYDSVFGNDVADSDILSTPSYSNFLSNDQQPTSDQNVPFLGSLLSAYHTKTDNDEDAGGASTWAPQLNIFSSSANDSICQKMFSSDANANNINSQSSSHHANTENYEDTIVGGASTTWAPQLNIFSSDANDGSSQIFFSSDAHNNNINSQSSENDEDVGGASTWAPQLNIFSSAANDSSCQKMFSPDANANNINSQSPW